MTVNTHHVFLIHVGLHSFDDYFLSNGPNNGLVCSKVFFPAILIATQMINDMRVEV